MKIFLTGLPGCGKTTVIKRALELIEVPATGIFTEEIRDAGRRVGFSVESLGGDKAVMSHVRVKSRCRVGRYGVDVGAFESLALPAISPVEKTTLVIIDEIGKMECFSSAFVELVRRLLDGPNPMLGTVARLGGGFPGEVRSRPDIKVLEVNIGNRDRLASEIGVLFRAR
jgi:nucleoside-triphosphatase